MRNQTTDIGVYFLANDRVLDLTIAFLNSFRFWNPELPLCLIPYNESCDAVRALASHYRFSIYENADVLTDCDKRSLSFYPRVVGEFRKLAAWDGRFERFIYIDVDTVVLMNMDFVFKLLNRFEFINSHSNIASSRKYTWKDSIYAVETLSEEQIEYSANMGFIASRKGALTQTDVDRAVRAAVGIKPHMETMCTDQPFMNFLVVTSKLRYTSISVLRSTGNFEYAEECWAGDENWIVQLNGRGYYAGEPKRVFFIHWAGQWLPGEHSRQMSPDMNVRDNLKQGAIWRFYRYLESDVLMAAAEAKALPFEVLA